MLTINSVDLRSSSLGLNIQAAANWSLAANIDSALKEVNAAVGSLRGKAQPRRQRQPGETCSFPYSILILQQKNSGTPVAD